MSCQVKVAGRISVIMPVYNVSDYVEKAVKSVLHQTYKNIELILIDDGSTDASIEICKRLALTDSRVKLIMQENQGVSAARNAGLKVATGDYITFADSDDWLSLDAYEKMIAYLCDTKADICVMGFEVESLNDINQTLQKKGKNVLSMHDALDDMFLGEIYTWSIWDKVYCREILKDLFFDDEIVNGEDLLFNWQAFGRANNVAYIPLWGYHYVQRNGSMTNSFTMRKLTVINAFEKILSSCNSDYFYRKINKQYIFTLIGLFGSYFCITNLDCWGFKFKELEYAQEYLRKHWRLLTELKMNKRQMIVAILAMFPIQITILILKIYIGIKH